METFLKTNIFIQHYASPLAWVVVLIDRLLIKSFIASLVPFVRGFILKTSHENKCFRYYPYERESGAFATGNICVTAGIHVPECIKDERDTIYIFVLAFMHNFHISTKNKLSQSQTGRRQQKGARINKL